MMLLGGERREDLHPERHALGAGVGTTVYPLRLKREARRVASKTGDSTQAALTAF
jgi:hypothetical protein